MQLPLERLYPGERIVLAERWRVKVDELAEKLRWTDQGDALGLRPPLHRGDLLRHPRIIGITEEDVDPVEAAHDDFARDQLLDCAHAVRRLVQVQHLARRDTPP